MIEIEAVAELRFADGSPVRAASAIARLGDGWLLAQDDATLGAWLRGDLVSPVRLFPPVEGLDAFSPVEGTKHLKPDVEAACEVDDGVLLLGSGSTAARMRAAYVDLVADEPRVRVADLSDLYRRVAELLSVEPDQLNLEGACVVEDVLRWWHRGLPAIGLPTGSVDIDLAGLLARFDGAEVAAVDVGGVRSYDFGAGLAVTDAVVVSDGRVLVSLAAEDTTNAYDDGPVGASALALLDGDAALWVAPLPLVNGQVPKVEGLSALTWSAEGGRVLATIDADDPLVPSALLTLRIGA